MISHVPRNCEDKIYIVPPGSLAETHPYDLPAPDPGAGTRSRQDRAPEGAQPTTAKPGAGAYPSGARPKERGTAKSGPSAPLEKPGLTRGPTETQPKEDAAAVTAPSYGTRPGNQEQ